METGSVIDFTWTVDENGYEWSNDPWRNEPVLSARTKIGEPLNTRRTRPLTDTPALHRAIRELTNTRHAIRDFATEHGQLRGETSRNFEHLGVPLSEWQDLIAHVSLATDIVDLLRDGNDDQIEHVVDLSHGRARIHLAYESEGYIWRPDRIVAREKDPHWNVIQMGGPNAALALWLLQEINTHLDCTVSARLRFEGDTFHRSAGKRLRPRLWLYPNSLKGAIWLQLAQDYDGTKDLRRCPTCRTWFDIAQAGGRSDRIYCSGACRAKASRQKALQRQ